MGTEIARKKPSTAILRPLASTSEVRERESGVTLSPALAARALGVTRQRLGQIVNEGRLHPSRDESGVRRFDRDEVLAYARARRRGPPGSPATNGRLAARVFDMFEQGAGLRAVVRETMLPPEEVRRLYREYMRPLSAEVNDRLEALENARDKQSHEFLMKLLDTKKAQAEAEALGRRRKAER